METDIAANRHARKWTPREQAGRLMWALASPLFRFSPRPIWWWRRFLLRLFGAKIGADVHIFPSVRIAIPWNLAIGDQTAIGDRVQLYNLGPLTIGRRVTVSQNAHLCGGTHNHRLAAFPLLKAPISVGDDAWICADAFVGPQTNVGDRAIVGARAVVIRDVGADSIVAGNPARRVGTRQAPKAEMQR